MFNVKMARLHESSNLSNLIILMNIVVWSIYG